MMNLMKLPKQEEGVLAPQRYDLFLSALCVPLVFDMIASSRLTTTFVCTSSCEPRAPATFRMHRSGGRAS